MDRFRDPDELARVLGDWMSGSGALYRRLATAVADAVSRGELHARDRLPSERDLARALHVSRATVVAAYDELRGGRIVESRSGSGSRVAAPAERESAAATRRLLRGRSAEVVRRFDDAHDDLISMKYALETGDRRIAEAAARAVADDLPDLLAEVGYAPRGLPALREAVAAEYTAAGLPTAADQVLVTSGTQQALTLVGQLLLDRGDVVAVESPSWPGCFDAFSALGARIEGIGLDDAGMRVDQLGALLGREDVSMVFVMPTFHNPTGTLMSEARRRDIARLTAEHGVAVVEDHAYSTPVTHTGPLPAPLAAHAPAEASVFTVGSFSKAAWAGLRIGWIRAGAESVDRLGYLKGNADMGTPLLEQALALRLLPRVPELVADRTAVARSRLAVLSDLLREHLPEWQWHEPAGGTALWVRLPGVDAAVFAQVALRHGVEVVPGRHTDPSGAWDDHLRLPFTYAPEVMSEAVRRLALAWQDVHAR